VETRRQAWWHIPIIPTVWEAEIGESQFKAGLNKSTRPYLKNKKE
jgi:hypothetical protein